MLLISWRHSEEETFSVSYHIAGRRRSSVSVPSSNFASSSSATPTPITPSASRRDHLARQIGIPLLFLDSDRGKHTSQYGSTLTMAISNKQSANLRPLTTSTSTPISASQNFNPSAAAPSTSTATVQLTHHADPTRPHPTGPSENNMISADTVIIRKGTFIQNNTIGGE